MFTSTETITVPSMAHHVMIVPWTIQSTETTGTINGNYQCTVHGTIITCTETTGTVHDTKVQRSSMIVPIVPWFPSARIQGTITETTHPWYNHCYEHGRCALIMDDVVSVAHWYDQSWTIPRKLKAHFLLHIPGNMKNI